MGMEEEELFYEFHDPNQDVTTAGAAVFSFISEPGRKQNKQGAMVKFWLGYLID